MSARLLGGVGVFSAENAVGSTELWEALLSFVQVVNLEEKMGFMDKSIA